MRRSPRVPGGVLPLAAMCVLFFTSGSVGLIYEVAWKHRFSAIFGTTTQAVTVVISVFMGGLALGAYVFGRLADRMKRHLLVFALLQVGVAASAQVVAAALWAAEGLYGAAFRTFGSPAILTLVQVVSCGLILLVPTFLMGGTLPVLSRYLAGQRGEVAGSVGLLYGVNTLGAAAGAFLTGFVLIRAVGIRGSVLAASLLNLLVAAGFVVLHVVRRRAEAVGSRATERESAPPFALPRWRTALLLGAVAVSGFVAFSYEVLWTRLLTFKFTTTVFAFSTMLGTFLLGLGLGGAAVPLLRRFRAGYWSVYGLLEGMIGLWGMATALLFFSGQGRYVSFADRVIKEFGGSALVMLVPTTLMGLAFPLACDLLARGARRTGSSVGRVWAYNTAGSVLGTMLTGFLFVKLLGTQHALEVVSLLMIASASALLLSAPGRHVVLLKGAVVAGLWSVALALVVATPEDYLLRYYLRNQPLARDAGDRGPVLLGWAEGPEAVVVATQAADGNRCISIGSLAVAGTSYALRNAQLLQAHVPMLLRPEARSVCQVGFGSGETARVFADYDLDRFDCVEISPEMVEVADRYFRDINGGVAHDPRCNLIIMDAVNYLKYTDRTYDIIANDATWPSQAGTSLLFTKEHFENGRRHLNPGGIMTSWMPLNMPNQDLRMIVKTFHHAFRYVYVYYVVNKHNKHAMLVGTEEPLKVDAGAFMRRFDKYARRDLALVLLDDPAVFLSTHLAEVKGNPPELVDVPLNTLDRPLIQYLFARPEEYASYREPKQLCEAIQFLVAHRDSILAHLSGLERLADGEAFREKLRRLDRANDSFLRSFVFEWQDPPRAVREFAAGASLAPEHPAARRAGALFARLPSATPQLLTGADLATVQDLAGRYFLAGRYKEAEMALFEWLRRRPDEAEPYAELGLLYKVQGRTDNAERYLRKAVELAPDDADALFNLGATYLSARRPERAVPYLRRALELEPNSSDVPELLGVALGLTGHPEEARPLLERAVRLAPEAPRPRRTLALFLCGQGRWKEALPHLEKLVALAPRDPQAHLLLAEALDKLGRRPQAEKHRRRAGELERRVAH